MCPGIFLLGTVSREVCNLHDARYLDETLIKSFLLSTERRPFPRKGIELRDYHGFLLGRNQHAVIVTRWLLTPVEIMQVLQV